MRRTRKKGERGQATVEFAIVLPMVLLLIAGVIEFGKAFNYWLSLNHLANEGSRWASVDRLPSNDTPSNDEFRTYLLGQIGAEELYNKLADDPANIRFCIDGTGQIGEQATVTIQTPYEFLILGGMAKLVSGLTGSDTNFGVISLAGSSTVRLEQVPTDWASEPPPTCPP